MTGKDLFRLRLKHHLKFFRRLQRVAIDWAVIIYIILPILFVFFLHYNSWWSLEADWLHSVNEINLALVIGFLLLLGFQHSFLHQADVLYLWQKKSLIRKLIRYRLQYYLVISFIRTVILILILSPILLLYLEWGPIHIVLFGGVSYLLHNLANALMRDLKVYQYRWTRALSYVGLYAVGSSVLFISTTTLGSLCSLILLVSINIFYLNLASKLKPKFYKEIELDANQRSKLTHIILAQSTYVGAPEFLAESPSRTRKKPWLFPNSRKIFNGYLPESGYREVYFKSLLRNRNWVLLYVQIIGVGLFGILTFPNVFKVLFWVGMLMLTGNLLKSYWGKVMTHRFIDLFNWKKMNMQPVAKQSFLLGMAPAWLILSVALGFKTLGIWGILFIPLIGCVLSRIIVRYIVSKI
ncbi:hypothetical protein E3U55_06755 [Filobacillus milosensis]|uniref:Uncharacterized protein n=1 Tax=Filobacillus milosensis TaxID=94137 RepID=A0A4Y8INB4_9BACI|nr:ABC transporter permease [Filobacillus milosensis]TFB22935.1 hypothetical protein E3U55_06755 [Filobacillus milosensis]